MKSFILKLPLSIFAAIAILSCSPQRHITTNSSDNREVEIRKRIEWIHDTISIPIAFERDSVCIPIDSLSILENSVARSSVRVIDGALILHTLQSIDTTITHPHKVQVEMRDSIIYHEKVKEHIIEVERELSLWQKFQIRGFWILSLTLSLCLLLYRGILSRG